MYDICTWGVTQMGDVYDDRLCIRYLTQFLLAKTM